ncbi:transcriptional repressor [Rhizophlyctis rosea]|uniref:Transcriptional repressor n=1 Tax=Rhizophlyctis rosea TaxID=64517 RepID=A0AAD5S430_9FUNG|nr:transcriptional repressor [Rhizophlyctis rosea]
MATTSSAVFTGRCSRGGVINLLCEDDVPYSPARERLRSTTSSSSSSAASSPITPTHTRPLHVDTAPRYFTFTGNGEELRPHPCLTPPPPPPTGWNFTYPPASHYKAFGPWSSPTPEPSPLGFATPPPPPYGSHFSYPPQLHHQGLGLYAPPSPGPSPPRFAPEAHSHTVPAQQAYTSIEEFSNPNTPTTPVNRGLFTTSSPPPSPTPAARKRTASDTRPDEAHTKSSSPVKRKCKAAPAQVVKKARKACPKKRHYCDECEKSFTTSGHLARHKRIHSGIKPFDCPLPECDSRFSRQDNMMQHYRTHVLKVSYNENGQNFFLDSGSFSILSANSEPGENDPQDSETESSSPATPSSSMEDEDGSEMEED